MRYHFRVSPPGDHVKLRILETDREGPLLVGDLQRPPARPRHGGTAALVLRAAALTLKIVAAIHWEALRLWLKGVRLVPRPIAAPANTVNTALAAAKHHDYTRSTSTAAGRKPGTQEGALVQ